MRESELEREKETKKKRDMEKRKESKRKRKKEKEREKGNVIERVKRREEGAGQGATRPRGGERRRYEGGFGDDGDGL